MPWGKNYFPTFKVISSPLCSGGSGSWRLVINSVTGWLLFIAVSLSHGHYPIFIEALVSLTPPWSQIEWEGNCLLFCSALKVGKRGSGNVNCTTLTTDPRPQHQALFCVLTSLPPKDSGLNILSIDLTGEIQFPLTYKFLCDILMWTINGSIVFSF